MGKQPSTGKSEYHYQKVSHNIYKTDQNRFERNFLTGISKESFYKQISSGHFFSIPSPAFFFSLMDSCLRTSNIHLTEGSLLFSQSQMYIYDGLNMLVPPEEFTFYIRLRLYNQSGLEG